MGDFNIDLLSFKTDNATDTVFAIDYVPVITKHTRIVFTSVTLRDHNNYTNNITGMS